MYKMLMNVLLCAMIYCTMVALWVHALATPSDEFKCDYQILQKVIRLEDQMSSLTNELEVAKNTIVQLNARLENEDRSARGTTYIHWGRTTCPGDAHLVYDGYVGGSSHTDTGNGGNILCLPTNPDYDHYEAGTQNAGKIYGAEYETSSYHYWSYIHDQDVPCAVCLIHRNNVIMVPGKNACPEDYVVEYKGYLMSEYHSHSQSEYVCVDNQPEMLDGGFEDKNGKLFYFVEGKCGSLACPPYVDGWELTCAVCSYSPDYQPLV